MRLPFWWTRKFWLGWVPGILTACLIIIGIVMIVFYHDVTAIYFDVRFLPFTIIT